MIQRFKWLIFIAVTVLFLMPAYLFFRNENWPGTGSALVVAGAFISMLFGRPNRPD